MNQIDAWYSADRGPDKPLVFVIQYLAMIVYRQFPVTISKINLGLYYSRI